MLLPNRQVGGLSGFLLTLMSILSLGMPPACLGGAEVSRRPFALAAADAEVTLEKFSDQSGAQVVYLIGEVRGVTTNPVQGEFAIREALNRLVAGTALRVERDEKTGAYAIRRDPKSLPPAAEPANSNTSSTLSMKKSFPAKFTAALAALGAALLTAQTTPFTVPKEEVVELSPFVVNASEDNGYQATNTLAGSRMNTSLRDTAASVSVLTSELLSDIGALNLNDAFVYANNVELDHTNLNNDNGTFEFFNTFRIRGQAATVARNYFRWKLPADLFNVERIEEARGPNSILFGIASAGGLISTQTKQASTNRNFRRAQLVYGSYDLRRATIDVNQTTFNEKLGVRFNAVLSDVQGYQHYVYEKDNRAHLAVKYNLTPNTVFRAEYEKGKTSANKANNQEIVDNAMKWYYAGAPVLLVNAADTARGITRNANGADLSIRLVETAPGVYYNYDARLAGNTQPATAGGMLYEPAFIDNLNFRPNSGGPGQTQESWFETYSAFLDHKLGKNTFLQLAFNHQDYDFEAWQASGASGLKGDPNRFMKDGVTPNPNAGGYYFESFWTHRYRSEALNNLRFSVSQELDFGKWGEYRLAGLAEREESNWSKDNYIEIWANEATNLGAFNTVRNSGVNRVMRRHYITPGDYGTYFSSFSAPAPITGMVDPSNPARTLKTAWTRAGIADFNDPQEQDSYLAAAQAFYFKRKLVLAGGYRADTLYLHEGLRGFRDPVTQDIVVDNETFPRANKTIDAHTRTYGVVYHALPWLSLRYNNARSLELTNGGIRLTPHPDENGNFIGGRVGDNPQGQGEDYGFDLNLLDGKIFVRATRFETIRAGAQQFVYGGTSSPSTLSNRVMDALQGAGLITQAERDLHQIDVGGSEFDMKSTGYELSVTANPTKNWRLSANYSFTDSVTDNTAPEILVWAAAEIPYFQSFNQNILVSTGDTVAGEIARWQAVHQTLQSVNGLGTIGNRREKLSVVTRYTFSDGLLKGLHVGATARHQSKMVIGATSANTLVYGNSITRADASLGYRFGRMPGLKFLKNLSLQLNVYNVLNQHDPLVMGVANENAAVLVPNRLLPQEPRYWRLSADLAF